MKSAAPFLQKLSEADSDLRCEGLYSKGPSPKEDRIDFFVRNRQKERTALASDPFRRLTVCPDTITLNLLVEVS